MLDCRVIRGNLRGRRIVRRNRIFIEYRNKIRYWLDGVRLKAAQHYWNISEKSVGEKLP